MQQVGCGVQGASAAVAVVAFRALVLLLLRATTLSVVDFIVRFILN